MISHIFKDPSKLPHSPAIHLLYSTRSPTQPGPGGEDISKHLDQVLFFPRLRNILHFQQSQPQPHSQHQRQQQQEDSFLRLQFHLYITNLHEMPRNPPADFSLHKRRIKTTDLHEVIGGKSEAIRNGYRSQARRTVCYICGPPDMTDELVAGAEEVLGAGVGKEKSVFYEKWW
ncbi:FNR-like superfamily domain, iron-sulfur binding ferredoxin reductase [Histoplasma capsulatum G186AR]|nr:FNR-like superfamily domain, iron-sulfur binding ferredoxin reductase [Histoplasma capsulatum]QSS70217.1 FNR-like superfamily domain, iron-sulfur binding ferredoxin reductase [Histoplasma capsulatum G186AR]